MNTATEERFFAKVDAGAGGGCHLWLAARNAKGYGHFYMDRRGMRAHRAAWTIRNGPIPDGIQVLHTCDRPGCVNPDHLFLGTDADNSADMVAKGRAARGEDNGKAKLTAAQVVEIRKGTETDSVLAERYGINPVYLGHVRRGTNWSHI